MATTLKQQAAADNGLSATTVRALDEATYDSGRVEPFLAFRQRVRNEVQAHPIIRSNPYTSWFRRGEFDASEARRFMVQFSVFSNEFLAAQLRKMLNAESLEEMRASKEILANEIGVTFRAASREAGDDAELGDLTGSVNGGTFRFRAAHFELLLRMAEPLGLSFADLGKRRFGDDTTLHFCDELLRLYGNEDYTVANAASFAVENWAAAGFWDELVEGWTKFRRRELPNLNLTFFSWHARLEATHAQHTMDELEEFYFTSPTRVDDDAFIGYAREMLDGVAVFWEGLARTAPGGTR